MATSIKIMLQAMAGIICHRHLPPTCRRNRPLWVGAIVVVATFFCGYTGSSLAASLEYRVKAAFLYNFTRFIDWPDSDQTNTSFIIGVVGKDPFGKELTSLAGKQIKGKNLIIRNFNKVEELDVCHILFISRSAKSHIKKILQATAGRPTLTVGDTDGYAQKGVIINFYEEKNKIRFEINLAAANQTGLIVSSRLLKLARIVNNSGK
jgi:hypothetical protein